MNTIQKKIYTLVAVVVCSMVVIWIALTYYNQKMQHQYNDILQRYLQMNEVSALSRELVTSLNNYIQSPSTDKLTELDNERSLLWQAKLQIAQLKNDGNIFTLTNYLNLIDSLIDSTDRSIRFLHENNKEEALNDFSDATRLSTYISEMTLTLFDTELKTYDQFYRDMIKQSELLNKLGLTMIAMITCILLLFTYLFSYSITRPIYKLTQAARELSRGRFDVAVEIGGNDEISFLAKTFDRMRINMNNLFSEIQHKAQLERELQTNKLLLQESQLLSLQSQIHPHFLFNTLDTLSKKVYLEGLEETSDLIASVARLLRYSLKRLDRPVTLYEEVMILREYMLIQRTRFTERLRYIEYIDEGCLYVQLPGLTLQPIIENAVIHAVEPLEHGGTITLNITDATDHVAVEITDEGMGMSDERIQQILAGNERKHDGHSTGIGFSNVVKRLRLFYGKENVIHIDSEEGKGTSVRLMLPKNRGVKHDA